LSGSTSGSPWRTSSSFRNCVAMISRCLTDCLSVSLHPSSISKPISQIINKISRPRRPVHHHHQPRMQHTIQRDRHQRRHGSIHPYHLLQQKNNSPQNASHYTPKKKNTSLRITLSESLSEPESSPWNQCKHDGLVQISLEQSLPVFLQLPSLLHPPYTRE
jgi:hypothetical protein